MINLTIFSVMLPILFDNSNKSHPTIYSITFSKFNYGFYRLIRSDSAHTVGRVFAMVIVSILPHAEFGRNDHRGHASYFIMS